MNSRDPPIKKQLPNHWSTCSFCIWFAFNKNILNKFLNKITAVKILNTVQNKYSSIIIF